MATASEPSVDRRSRTRTALLAAGQRLFAERPVDAVSVDEIVLAAGVAKGSFFNHFADKHQFARAIAADIRRSFESEVGRINSGESDPVVRLTGGMLMAVHFALTRHDQTLVMLRGSPLATSREHPLNHGLRLDLAAAGDAGLLRAEGQEAALLFWLGACNMLMLNVTEREFGRTRAAQRMQQMMVLALTGLGIDPDRARAVAASRAAQLKAMG
ncbi:MAG: TetR/AcrR family transcriptional regulator [Novosphingobium sp.]